MTEAPASSGSMSRSLEAAIVAASAFVAYVAGCAPELAPYRDTGEMVSVLKTLGVAHPPGYPLYALLGRLFLLIPAGNVASRANVFSAAASALALAFLYRLFRATTPVWAATLGALWVGVSLPFWELASVGEMYALGMLAVALLLYLVFVREDPVLTGFVLG